MPARATRLLVGDISAKASKALLGIYVEGSRPSRANRFDSFKLHGTGVGRPLGRMP